MKTNNRPKLSRRRLLRCATGGMGTAMAMPALQAMFGSDTAYAAGAVGQPRFLAIYQPNGHQAATFTPPSARVSDMGNDNCAPLMPIMDKTTIFRNLNSASGSSGGNAHLTAICSWLSAKPVPNDRATKHSITLDVKIANHYEATAPTGQRQHLALAGSPFIDPGRMSYNNDMKSWLSTDRNGNRIQSDNNLNRTFDNLFSGFDPGVSQLQIEQRRLAKKSVLDFVLDDVKDVENRLGAADKNVLSSYFDNIRDLENRLSQPGSAGGGGTCGSPMQFGNYAPFAPDRTEPNIDVHWQETAQLLSVAFQCEAVRSVSYMIETEAGESGYPKFGLPDSHALSHNPGTPNYGKRDNVHSALYTEMVQLFENTPVGEGNLMDHLVIVWGGGIGVNHSKDQLFAVVSGQPGRPSITHNRIRDMGRRNAWDLMSSLGRTLGAVGSNEAFGNGQAGSGIDL